MFCSFPSTPPYFCVAHVIREYFSWIRSLQANGCFSLSARVSSLHPVGLIRAPLTKAFSETFLGLRQPATSSPTNLG